MPELIEFDITGGYWPSTSAYPPPQFLNTIKAGKNVWLRPGNLLQVARDVLQLSATTVGNRIFALNDDRAEIAGALVSQRLPFSGIIRYLGGVLFFVSEQTGQQVYINETAVAGLTTASSANILRVAVPDGVGGYNVYDAGFEKPTTPTVATAGGGAKAMTGATGVALCAWRTTTNAISRPSEITYNTLAVGSVIRITLPSAVSGQDGWIYAGTAPGDTSGTLRIVRYIRITPRGTFTATNGSVNITAGVGTFFNQDLRVGDVVTINAASYTIATVTSQTTATLTANFAGATGAGKTMTITTAQAEWYSGELGDLVEFDVFKPPKAAGVLQFMGRAFIFGTDGESTTAVTGPGIRLMLDDNPEHVGLSALSTVYGDDILNVLAANDMRARTCYIMTQNTLEVFELTDDPDAPYRIRVIRQPGFGNPKAGVVYQDVFYGFSRQPFRTTTDGNIDTSFGQTIADDMRRNLIFDAVLGVDQTNEAVLFSGYTGPVTNTSIVWAFHPSLGGWSPPIYITGQITDFVTVSGTTYAVISGKANQWDAIGASFFTDAYIQTQYHLRDGVFEIDSFLFSGIADEFVYNVAIHEAVNETFTQVLGSEVFKEFYPSLWPGSALAIRVNFGSVANGALSRMQARINPKMARR